MSTILTNNTSKFYCKTSTGQYPPRYIHHSIEAAVNEAKRLSIAEKCDVEILKIVGKVEWKEIPVTEKKPVLTMELGYHTPNIDDDLPF